MWILSKNREYAFDTSKMFSLFVAGGSGGQSPAVRCGIDAQKAMTLGAYDTADQCRAVLKVLLQGVELDKTVFRMPGDEEAARLAEAEHMRPKERAADGKKTVRRGGS